MKKKIWITIAIVLVAFIGYIGYTLLTTKSHSPFKETAFNYKGTDITVAYSQPYKKGRLIFGDKSEGALQPFDKYWRLGANESTIITFSTDVVFAGERVEAGSYRMYTVPGKENFEVSLNSELGKWGAMEPDYSLDVLKVKVPASTSANVIEQFAINFAEDSSGVQMTFEWDTTVVTVVISI